MGASSSQLKTIQRTTELIDVLKEQKSVGVSELARRMDLPKSTVHAYLCTLESTGYVTNDDGTYSLGFRVLELGSRVKYRDRLFHVAVPELERLVDLTGELTSVNLEERGQFVILHAEYGSESLRLGTYPGMTTPLHTHAAGKVMLAEFPTEKTERILEERPLERMTEHTITDRAELFDELEGIRERGYGVDWDEQIVGMGVVAAPICCDDRVVGSIGLVCPTDKLSDGDYREDLVREVRKSANIVSVNYQYHR
jgi:DNA-binding IclR family transcriptional regulator